MIRKVLLLIGKDKHDAKLHFSSKLGEAFEHKGIKTIFFNVLQPQMQEKFSALVLSEKPDLCCTFYPRHCKELIPHFWEQHQLPFVVLLIDPLPGWALTPHNPWLYFACCDLFHCEFMQTHGVSNVFFLGHGVERDLVPEENQERTYDVVFLGSSYEPYARKEEWKKYPEVIQKAIERAAERYLSDLDINFWQVVDQEMREHAIQLNTKDLIDIYTYVLMYCQALDRLELIRAVESAHVDVFGGTNFFTNEGAKGWQYYLADKKNITVHPAITLDEGMEVLKKSKICLNSMPFFKNGTHERLFLASACGCLVVTTDTPWVRERFSDGHDLILYQPYHWNEINDRINYFLNHEQARQELVNHGRAKVMRDHTWDQRVEQLLTVMTPMLERIKS